MLIESAIDIFSLIEEISETDEDIIETDEEPDDLDTINDDDSYIDDDADDDLADLTIVNDDELEE